MGAAAPLSAAAAAAHHQSDRLRQTNSHQPDCATLVSRSNSFVFYPPASQPMKLFLPATLSLCFPRLLICCKNSSHCTRYCCTPCAILTGHASCLSGLVSAMHTRVAQHRSLPICSVYICNQNERYHRTWSGDEMWTWKPPTHF